MAVDIKRYTDFLQSLGTKDARHTGQDFFAHLVGVYRDLKKWGREDPVCLAGMFHSIYGTQTYKDFSLPLDRRDEVRKLIGNHAEKIAYVNCVMDRASLDSLVRDGGELRVQVRETGEWIDLTEQEFHDLCVVHLCDWLEQVERSDSWTYRRISYRAMAEHLGGIALESYDLVFEREPAESRAALVSEDDLTADKG